MHRSLLTLGLAAVMTTFAAAPDIAGAHPHHWRRYHHSCSAEQHRAGATGAVAGAIGGAVIGNGLSRGNRGPGTLLGAGLGALAGHQIAKSTVRC